MDLDKSNPTTVTVPKAHWISKPDSGAKFVFETTCGPVEVRALVEGDEGTESFERDLGKASGAVTTTVRPESVAASTLLYVDNVGASTAQTISIGKRTLTVPPNKALRQSIMIGSCARNGEVRVGNAVVGTTPDPQPKRAILIDAAGGHCYGTSVVSYSGPPPEGGTIPIAGSRVFSAPIVDYLLVKAPETVTVAASVANEAYSVTELLRTKCPTVAPAAAVRPVAEPGRKRAPAKPAAAPSAPRPPAPAGEEPPL